MQSFRGSVRLLRRHAGNSSKILDYNVTRGSLLNRASVLSKPHHSAWNEVEDIKFVDRFIDCLNGSLYQFMPKFSSNSHLESAKAIKTDVFVLSNNANMHSVSPPYGGLKPGLLQQCASLQTLSSRCFTTMNSLTDSVAQDVSASSSGVAPRIKFKRLDKTAKHIMQILDKEAVEEVRKQREIPDIKPGDIIQLKVEVPENKRRVSMLKGIVIARRNAGLNTTFRLRRLVAGVGIESLFLLYSPNIKEIKLLDKKKVRRAKLYYLRDRMNPLKK